MMIQTVRHLLKEYDKANVAEVHSDSELAIATSCFLAADYW